MHAQTVEDEAPKMWASSQNIAGAGWSDTAQMNCFASGPRRNRKPGSYRSFPDSMTHRGKHIPKPVHGVIDTEAIRVMTCRRRTTQGRGERI